MKYTHPSLRWVSLAPAALALLLGACGGDDSSPSTPNPPPPDASNTADQSSTTPDVKTNFDAGSRMCGAATCTGAIAGGQIGVACCAGPMMDRCGLQFLGSTQCIDQSDSGGFQPPPMDAGPITPDPSCGNVSITFGGMSFTLDGCCRADGFCGWYSQQAPGQGCASATQLSQIPGTTLPDAPIACSGEGGSRPDTGTTPDAGRPDTSNPPDSTTPPDGGAPDNTGSDAPTSDVTTSDTTTTDTTTTDSTTSDTTTTDTTTTDTGTQTDGATSDGGNG